MLLQARKQELRACKRSLTSAFGSVHSIIGDIVGVIVGVIIGVIIGGRYVIVGDRFTLVRVNGIGTSTVSSCAQRGR